MTSALAVEASARALVSDAVSDDTSPLCCSCDTFAAAPAASSRVESSSTFPFASWCIRHIANTDAAVRDEHNIIAKSPPTQTHSNVRKQSLFLVLGRGGRALEIGLELFHLRCHGFLRLLYTFVCFSFCLTPRYFTAAAKL